MMIILKVIITRVKIYLKSQKPKEFYGIIAQQFSLRTHNAGAVSSNPANAAKKHQHHW